MTKEQEIQKILHDLVKLDFCSAVININRAANCMATVWKFVGLTPNRGR